MRRSVPAGAPWLDVVGYSQSADPHARMAFERISASLMTRPAIAVKIAAISALPSSVE
jgi:hypothetical protein